MAAIQIADKVETVQLHLQGEKARKIAKSLSAVEQVGDALWVAGDEVSSVERLRAQDWRRFADHASLDLKAVFGLVDGKEDEIDLEGLSYDDATGRLWLIGSHSIRRGKNDETNPTLAGELAALGPGENQPNRYLLGAIDIRQWEAEGEGAPPLLRQRHVRSIPRTQHGNDLTAALRAAAVFAPFMDIPSKDNGFDIEGIAARDGQVFIGLRGPVMNGWASILQCAPTDAGAEHLSLHSQGSGPEIWHHLLDLDGLGVRDLCVQGNDLLILAGPTMKLDRPFIVYRWPDGARSSTAQLVTRAAREALFELPSGGQVGNPEGITLFKEASQDRLLVVYDREPQNKDKHNQYYVADLFRLD